MFQEFCILEGDNNKGTYKIESYRKVPKSEW